MVDKVPNFLHSCSITKLKKTKKNNYLDFQKKVWKEITRYRSHQLYWFITIPICNEHIVQFFTTFLELNLKIISKIHSAVIFHINNLVPVNEPLFSGTN